MKNDESPLLQEHYSQMDADAKLMHGCIALDEVAYF
jgi:hypothetical protein